MINQKDSTNNQTGNKELGNEEARTESSVKDEVTTNENELIKEDNTLSIANDIAAESSLDASEAEEELRMAEISEDTKDEVHELIKLYYNVKVKLSKDLLMTTSQEEEDKTIASIEKKREVIEKYKNIKTVLKPGLKPNTYVVFTTYDTKLNNIDSLVPGMSLLYLVSNEKGKLSIYNDTPSDELSGYFEQMTREEDIKKLIDEVNTKLAAVITEDAALKELVEYLKAAS
jgi:hypothetical protein